MNLASSSPAAVTCRDCRFSWYSAAMARGLRLLGSCPRCAGRLRFATGAGKDAPEGRAPRAAGPHLVFGLPRGRRTRQRPAAP